MFLRMIPGSELELTKLVLVKALFNDWNYLGAFTLLGFFASMTKQFSPSRIVSKLGFS